MSSVLRREGLLNLMSIHAPAPSPCEAHSLVSGASESSIAFSQPYRVLRALEQVTVAPLFLLATFSEIAMITSAAFERRQFVYRQYGVLRINHGRQFLVMEQFNCRAKGKTSYIHSFYYLRLSQRISVPAFSCVPCRNRSIIVISKIFERM